ncbi:hypothetical protein C8J57DRAFT_1241616 [Mycena rebaudengoi]|nr:hypothetical protein C8J57DRAFT_1241616 [Mycena rebaudengoi]
MLAELTQLNLMRRQLGRYVHKIRELETPGHQTGGNTGRSRSEFEHQGLSQTLAPEPDASLPPPPPPPPRRAACIMHPPPSTPNNNCCGYCGNHLVPQFAVGGKVRHSWFIRGDFLLSIPAVTVTQRSVSHSTPAHVSPAHVLWSRSATLHPRYLHLVTPPTRINERPPRSGEPCDALKRAMKSATDHTGGHTGGVIDARFFQLPNALDMWSVLTAGLPLLTPNLVLVLVYHGGGNNLNVWEPSPPE